MFVKAGQFTVTGFDVDEPPEAFVIVAWIVSVPAMFDVYVNDAWPLVSVVAVPVRVRFGPAITVKRTLTFASGWPVPSVTDAVTVYGCPSGLVPVGGPRRKSPFALIPVVPMSRHCSDSLPRQARSNPPVSRMWPVSKYVVATPPLVTMTRGTRGSPATSVPPQPTIGSSLVSKLNCCVCVRMTEPRAGTVKLPQRL